MRARRRMRRSASTVTAATTPRASKRRGGTAEPSGVRSSSSATRPQRHWRAEAESGVKETTTTPGVRSERLVVEQSYSRLRQDGRLSASTTPPRQHTRAHTRSPVAQKRQPPVSPAQHLSQSDLLSEPWGGGGQQRVRGKGEQAGPAPPPDATPSLYLTPRGMAAGPLGTKRGLGDALACSLDLEPWVPWSPPTPKRTAPKSRASRRCGIATTCATQPHQYCTGSLCFGTCKFRALVWSLDGGG